MREKERKRIFKLQFRRHNNTLWAVFILEINSGSVTTKCNSVGGDIILSPVYTLFHLNCQLFCERGGVPITQVDPEAQRGYSSDLRFEPRAVCLQSQGPQTLHCTFLCASVSFLNFLQRQWPNEVDFLKRAGAQHPTAHPHPARKRGFPHPMWSTHSCDVCRHPLWPG